MLGTVFVSENTAVNKTVSTLKELIFSCRKQVMNPQINKCTITTLTHTSIPLITTITEATSVSILLLMIINT